MSKFVKLFILLFSTFIFLHCLPGIASPIQATTSNSDDILKALNSWEYTTQLPGPAKHASCMFKKNGYLFIIGGMSENLTFRNEIYSAEIKPDGTIGQWVQLNNFPVTIGRAASVVVGNRVYVLGGGKLYSGAEMKTVYTAEIHQNGNLSSWSLLSSKMNITRVDFSAAYLNGYIYAIGGGSYEGGYLSSVEYAKINEDGTLGEWTYTTPLNEARWIHRSIVVQGNIYTIGGGVTHQAEFAQADSDGKIKSWVFTGGTIPSSYHGEFLVSLNTTIYAYGGWDSQSHEGVDLVSANINQDGTLSSWTITNMKLNEHRSDNPGIIYNNVLYACGGHNQVDGYSISSTIEYLNLNTLNRAITFSSATDTSRFVYELPPDNICTTLATISWVSTFDGNDGILKATFTKPNQGVKMTLQIPEWFSSDSGKWYQLSINYRASSKSSTNNFQTILHTYEGILPSPTTLSGNGLLSCPTTWFTLRNYIHANGSHYGMFPQIVFKNYGSESVTVYIDSIQVWEVIAPLMNYNNFTAGSFDQSSDTTFWQYELPSDVADDLSVFGIDSGKFFVDFSGATTEGLKMTMATAPGSVISYSSDMDYFSGQNFQYEYTGTKGTKDSMVLVCMYSYDSAYDDPEEISAIARINSLNEVDAGYLETIFQPRESSVYSQIIIKNESQGTLWIDEAYPLLDFNKVD